MTIYEYFGLKIDSKCLMYDSFSYLKLEVLEKTHIFDLLEHIEHIKIS